MLITYLGHASFKIQCKPNAEEVSIITDPFEEKMTGLKMPHLQADIVTVSHQHTDHNNIAALRGESFVISQPGEYEVKKVFIYGIPSWHDKVQGQERGSNTIYRFEAEDLVLVHLGDLGHTLSDEQIEKIGEVDILLIPVGGVYTINAKEAVELVNQLEPRIVIPMHYQVSGLKLKLDSVNNFVKQSGLKPENLDKLRINKKELPLEETRLIILAAAK